MRTLFVVNIAIMGMVAACGLERPEQRPLPEVPKESDPSGKTDPQTPGHGTDPGSTTPQATQIPTVDQPPATVCTSSVAIQGSAGAGASVVVFGGAYTTPPKDVDPTTGHFCIDVPLKEGQANQLEVRAHYSAAGKLSDPRTVSVTHTTCTDKPDDAEPDKPKAPERTNVALGLVGKSSEAPALNNESYITDNKTSTFVEYNGGYGWGDYNGWVAIKLSKLVKLDEIVVHWRDTKGGTDEYFGVAYQVLVSPEANPGDPSLTTGHWVSLRQVTDGDGGVDKFDFSGQQPLAQHIALWLQQDGSGWTWTETFAISELEVWVSNEQGPNIGSLGGTSESHTCAGIGAGN
jgi:hypothetical protein